MALQLLCTVERTVENYNHVYNIVILTHTCIYYTLSYETFVYNYALTCISYVCYNFLTYMCTIHNSQSGTPTCPLSMYGLLYSRRALWLSQLETRVISSPFSSLLTSFVALSLKRTGTRHSVCREVRPPGRRMRRRFGPILDFIS